MDDEARGESRGGESVSIGSTAPQSPELRSAIEHCRQVCHSHARNFYYGLKLSPEPQRSALYVLYAWMRMADDLADGAMATDRDAARKRIETFRESTRQSLNGASASNEPIWMALSYVAEQYGLHAKPFHDMLDGQLDDLERNTYNTFSELHNYCERVASTVGLLCVEVWGYEDASARDLATSRGIAFQLTNIIRDYAQDFDTGRVYFPREDYSRFNLTPEELRHWSKPRVCAAFMHHQVERAESFYQQSSRLDDLITPAFRPTLWAMTAIYHALLMKIAADPAKAMTRRVRLSAWYKASIALRARWTASGRMSRTVLSHTPRAVAQTVRRDTARP